MGEGGRAFVFQYRPSLPRNDLAARSNSWSMIRLLGAQILHLKLGPMYEKSVAGNDFFARTVLHLHVHFRVIAADKREPGIVFNGPRIPRFFSFRKQTSSKLSARIVAPLSHLERHSACVQPRVDHVQGRPHAGHSKVTRYRERYVRQHDRNDVPPTDPALANGTCQHSCLRLSRA